MRDGHLAHKARVERLYLFHHDHAHDDDAIDRKVAQAADILQSSKTVCVQPSEGEVIRL